MKLHLSGLCVALAIIAAPAHARVFVVDDSRDAVDAKPGDGVCATAKPATCTLRAAVQEANALAGADEITLPVGTYSLSLAGEKENEAATGDLDITESLAITGAGIDQTIIDGMAKDRIFDIIQSSDHQMVDVAISGATIKNGRIQYADSYGGALLTDGHLTLKSVLFDNNLIDGDKGTGGALCNLGGVVDMQYVRFTRNRADDHAGAVCNIADGVMTVLNGTFDGNSTIIDGVLVHRGGAVLSAGIFVARDSAFSNNRSVFGGGLYLEHGSASLINVEVTTNISYLHGGGLHVGSHDAAHNMAMPVEFYAGNSAIRGNSILGGTGSDGDPQGGGMFVTGGSQVILENTQVVDNDAKGGCFSCKVNGGGINIGDGDVVLNRVTVARNKAAQWGGGLFVSNNRDIQDPTDPLHHVVNNVRIIESEIIENAALTLGGGIAAEYAHDPETLEFIPTVNVEYSLIADNKAFNGGGIVGSVNARNTTISGNKATGSATPCVATDPLDPNPDFSCSKGGGIFVPGKNYVLSLTNVTMANNSSTATQGGADIYNRNAASLTVKQSIIASADPVGNCLGPVVSENYNLSVDSSCALGGADDLESTPAQLAALASNDAGTRPRSHALEAGSPARDMVPQAACPQFDQRLFERVGDRCDAGAVEADSVAATIGELVVEPVPEKIDEDAKSLTVKVNRTGGSQGQVTLEYRIRPASATLGVDGDINIDTPRGTLSWDDGDATSRELVISVNDDKAMEMDEHFTIELFSPVVATMADSPQIHLVTIPSNDHPVDPGASPGTPDTGGDSGGGGSTSPAAVALLLLGAARMRRRIRAWG